MSTTDNLISQLNERLAQLHIIHNEIGTSTNKQQQQKQLLFEAMIRAADQHVDQVVNERNALEDNIHATHARILTLKRLMGEFVTDNGFVRKDTLLATLQDLEMEKQVVQKVRQVLYKGCPGLIIVYR